MIKRTFIFTALLSLLTASSSHANLNSLKKVIHCILIEHASDKRLTSWLNKHKIQPEEHKAFLAIIHTLIPKKEYQREAVIRTLLEYNIVHGLDISHYFFLHQAVEYDLYDVAQLLLQRDAEVNQLDQKFETPLDKLFYRNCKDNHAKITMPK